MTFQDQRITQQEMFMLMAEAASLRSTCRRRKVGCVVTNWDGTSVVGIGYNGNARGLPNRCDSEEPGQCGCIHAEVNALLKAPYQQGQLILYSTCLPCEACAKLILNSQVKRVIYRDPYRTDEGKVVLMAGKVEVVPFDLFRDHLDLFQEQEETRQSLGRRG